MIERLVQMGIPRSLAERIAPWVQHNDECDSLIWEDGKGQGPCSCGLEVVLEAPGERNEMGSLADVRTETPLERHDRLVIEHEQRRILDLFRARYGRDKEQDLRETIGLKREY